MIEEQTELISALEKLRAKMEVKDSVSILDKTLINALIAELKKRDMKPKKLRKLWDKYYQLEREVAKET